jgi:hypothetical protein
MANRKRTKEHTILSNMNPTKTGDELRFLGRVRDYCSTSNIRRVKSYLGHFCVSPSICGIRLPLCSPQSIVYCHDIHRKQTFTMCLKQYFDRIYQLQMNTQNIRHFEAKVQRNAYCKIVTLLMNLFVYYVSVCDFMIDGACILTWTYHIDAVGNIYIFIHPRVSYFPRAMPSGNMILLGE